jgi:hypothetical protein
MQNQCMPASTSALPPSAATATRLWPTTPASPPPRADRTSIHPPMLEAATSLRPAPPQTRHRFCCFLNTKLSIERRPGVGVFGRTFGAAAPARRLRAALLSMCKFFVSLLARATPTRFVSCPGRPRPRRPCPQPLRSRMIHTSAPHPSHPVAAGSQIPPRSVRPPALATRTPHPRIHASPAPPVASRNLSPKSRIPSKSGQNAPQIEKVSRK